MTEALAGVTAENTRATLLAGWYRRLAWIFLAIALARGLLIVASDPLLAVANNADMIRVQACIDAYPDRDVSIPPGTYSYEAPLARYRFITGVGAPCFVTSQVVFAWIAWPGMWLEQHLRADATFSIRWHGYVQLSLLSLLALLCTRRLIAAGREDLAAGYAAICALVLADPGNTLYLNTFYTEAAAWFFLHALLASVLIALAQHGRASPLLLAGIALFAALLALAKIQHLLLPLIVLVAVLLPALLRRPVAIAVAVAIGIGTLIGGGFQWSHMNSANTGTIRSANVIDTLFMAMLPNASQPVVLLEHLGLPAACAEQAGNTWYTPGMADRRLCPEVAALDHSDLLRALIRDPALVMRTVLGGFEYMRPWIPSHLGIIEGAKLATLPASIPTWSRALDALGLPLLIAGVLGFPLLGVLVMLVRREGEQAAVNILALALCCIPLYVVVTAVFGDGYVELSKHVHLALAAFLTSVTVFGCLLVDRVLRGNIGAS
jgi:hypothetical protein